MNEDLKLILADEEAPERLDPVETIIAPIGRSRRLITCMAICGAMIGLSMALLRPNQFQSSGKLLVRSGAREAATPESALTESDTSDAYNRDAVNNEVHLLSDPQVFQRAAEKVGPERILASPDAAELDDDSTPFHVAMMHRFQNFWFRRNDGNKGAEASNRLRAATKALMQGMTVQAEPYSSIIAVSYTSHSPTLAREVVEAFLVASDEHHRATFASDSSLEFLEYQVDNALAEAMSADKELTAFRVSCNAYDIIEQRDNLITVSQTLEQEIASDENRLKSLDTLSKFLRLELETVKQTIEVVDSGGLRPGISSGTSQTVVNPRWERLAESLDESQIEQTALTAAAELKRKRYFELRDELIKLEECEPELRMLEMDAKRKRERAGRFLEAFDRSDLLNLLDQVEMSNLRLIQAATMPLGKVGPIRSKLVAVGLVLGFALGVGIAFALHIFDRRLRTKRDAERALNVPILAVVNEAPEWTTTRSTFSVLSNSLSFQEARNRMKRKKAS